MAHTHVLILEKYLPPEKYQSKPTNQLIFLSGRWVIDYVISYKLRRDSVGFVVVAARLRSLRSDDPLSKGQPRSIKQELETLKTFQTHLWTFKFMILFS